MFRKCKIIWKFIGYKGGRVSLDLRMTFKFLARCRLLCYCCQFEQYEVTGRGARFWTRGSGKGNGLWSYRCLAVRCMKSWQWRLSGNIHARVGTWVITERVWKELWIPWGSVQRGMLVTPTFRGWVGGWRCRARDRMGTTWEQERVLSEVRGREHFGQESPGVGSQQMHGVSSCSHRKALLPMFPPHPPCFPSELLPGRCFRSPAEAARRQISRKDCYIPWCKPRETVPIYPKSDLLMWLVLSCADGRID